ncbi:MAG: methyltransferase domain-containing protein [Chloroflexi bacterium]|jgi:SAM-dependent methyltransferase|nr:methyltransferase domain-containing protein [Chloroflexota bacterium]
MTGNVSASASRPARYLPQLLLRPARVDTPELLDRSGHDPALLAGNLADLSRVNRWLGGIRLTLQALERLVVDLPPGAALHIVDVGAGGADIPAAVAEWAARRGLRPRILAVDICPEILRLATRSPMHAVAPLLADGRGLPFADGSLDVAICSLVLHHLSPEHAVALLREMGRVARHGIVVNDLVRTWMGYLGAWLLSRALTRNPLTRHDAPLSVRKAYTRAELVELLSRAGLRPVAGIGFLGYRLALAARRPA